MHQALFLATAIVASSSAFAQSSVDDCEPCGTVKYAGVYHVASGVLEPAGDVPADFAPLGVIYNNSCNTGFLSGTLNNSTLIDDGRVPTVTSPSPNTGSQNNYRVTRFQLGYCVRDLSGVVSLRVRFWNDLLQNSATCTTLAGAGTPDADYTIAGVPGAATQGTLTCYLLDIDLTGVEFCLLGDADGTFGNGDAFEDGFGYGLSMSGQLGTTAATTGGFLIRGAVAPFPTPCPFGQGTYFNTPFVSAANGLGNDTTFYRDGQGGQTTGCFLFGGGAAGGLGFQMVMTGDLGACALCPGNPDTDGDGVLNCEDGCPNDPNKDDPGICGCGVPDVGDADGDGTLDCVDGCPNDPNKIAPGLCGCGVADTDTDGDGTPDCNDACPNDPNKVAEGQCGCGVPDTDTDGDGFADCIDTCPNDPDKFLDVGQCGCNVPETDTDGDGFADCIDGCPNDPNKSAPGACGCDVPDTDTDGDGTPDCNDGCPNDPNKTSAGQCGCDLPDTDTDGDGTADCNDGCPNDPLKTSAGTCGCGVADTDTDGDGVADCDDNCDSIANPGQQDCNGNGIGDACDLAACTSLDVNGNTVPDECEPGAGEPFCFGDGGGTACPCGNTGASGHGCGNSAHSTGALLYNAGSASIGSADTALHTIQLPANKFALVYMGVGQVNGGLGIASYDGLRCVGGFTKRYPVQNTGACGTTLISDPGSIYPSLVTAGTTWFFQTWTRDDATVCGQQANYSNALSVTFVP